MAGPQHQRDTFILFQSLRRQLASRRPGGDKKKPVPRRLAPRGTGEVDP